MARLYPLHLATLLLMALLFRHNPGNSALRFAPQLFMPQAFTGDVGRTFNGPSWSISVAAVCYLLLAPGAWRGRRYRHRAAPGWTAADAPAA